MDKGTTDSYTEGRDCCIGLSRIIVESHKDPTMTDYRLAILWCFVSVSSASTGYGSVHTQWPASRSSDRDSHLISCLALACSASMHESSRYSRYLGVETGADHPESQPERVSEIPVTGGIASEIRSRGMASASFALGISSPYLHLDSLSPDERPATSDRLDRSLVVHDLLRPPRSVECIAGLFMFLI